jgi:HEPN domain-containing protein
MLTFHELPPLFPPPTPGQADPRRLGGPSESCAPWLDGPRRLWSLADLVTSLPLFDFLVAFHVLWLRLQGVRNGAESRIEPELLSAIVADLRSLEELCRTSRLHDLGMEVSKVRDRLSNPYNRPRSCETVYVLLDTLYKDLHGGLQLRAFASIPRDRTDYFEQEAMFGEQVAGVLRDASADIKSAGNCFAAEEYTATVFHLMRAVEHGLRALAKKLRVKLTHSRRPLRIEDADWNNVITACKNKIDAARRLPPGPRRREKLESYSDAVDHCTYMKDIWRNNVSHARRPYIESEAQAVMDRVRGFLVLLAERVL